MNSSSNKTFSTLLIVGLLFIVWGVIGLVDSKKDTYQGYYTDDNYTIYNIEEGSPAQKAGLLDGDIVKSYDGIPITSSKELAKRDRNKIGEEIEIVVDRNGTEKTLKMTYEAVPAKDKILNFIAFLIGIIFVVLGVLTHQRKRSSLSLLFTVFAICFGFNFLSGPYVSNELLAKIIASLTNTVLLFSFAVLTNFLLSYPPQSKFLNRKNKFIWIYGPAFVILVFFWIIIFVQPDGTSSFNQFIRLLVGALLVGYFGISVVLLIVKYLKASVDIRKQTGLNHMFWGTIIGLGPILLVILIETISPRTVLPGSDYIFLTMVAIPVFFSIAVLKQVKQVAEN